MCFLQKAEKFTEGKPHFPPLQQTNEQLTYLFLVAPRLTTLKVTRGVSQPV